VIPIAPRDATRWSAAAFIVAALAAELIGTAISAWGAASLRFIPPGSSVRPMGAAAIMFIGWLVGAAGIPLAIGAMFRSSGKPLAIVAAVVLLLLSVMPWFVGHAVWDHFETARGLIMEP
jgi:hypothetical protein